MAFFYSKSCKIHLHSERTELRKRTGDNRTDTEIYILQNELFFTVFINMDTGNNTYLATSDFIFITAFHQKS